MKKLAIMLLALAVSSNCVYGQSEQKKERKLAKKLTLDDNETTRFAISIQGARMTMLPGYELESFRRFRQSYNTLNANRLSSPLGDLRPTGSYSWGGGIHFIFKNMYYGVSVVRYNMEAGASATFRNGDVREMRMVMKPINTDFVMLMGFGKRIKAGMAIGYEEQHTTLYSGYRYNGGRLSYGTDQALNGVFHGSSDFGITLGVRADVAIVRQLRLMVRGDYIGTFAGKQKDGVTDYELNPWKDQMYLHSASGGVHNDNDNHFYLPENVASANDENVYFVGQGANFARLYRGWRLTIGLELDLWAPQLN